MTVKPHPLLTLQTLLTDARLDAEDKHALEMLLAERETLLAEQAAVRAVIGEFRERQRMANRIASTYTRVEDISRLVALAMTWTTAAEMLEAVLGNAKNA